MTIERMIANCKVGLLPSDNALAAAERELAAINLLIRKARFIVLNREKFQEHDPGDVKRVTIDQIAAALEDIE